VLRQLGFSSYKEYLVWFSKMKVAQNA